MKKRFGVLALVLCLVCSFSFAQGCSAPASSSEKEKSTVSSTTAKAASGDKVKACSDNQAAPAGVQPPKMPKIDPKVWDFLPETVAVIGEKKISKEELLKALAPQVKMLLTMGQKLKSEQYQKLAKNMVDELIKATILKKLAAAAGYKVTPKLEEDVYKKFTARFEKQLPEGKKVSFEDIIKKQGLNIDDVKKQLAEGEVVQEWIKSDVSQGIKIDDAVATKFYNENKDRLFKRPETVSASHILFKPAKDTPEGWQEAKTKAENVYKEVQAGGNFAELAKKDSQCPSAKNGGKLGSFGKGQMVPAFEKACWKLAKDNKINGTDLVKTKFGWHIIKVTGYNPGGYIKLDKRLLDEIKQQLNQQEIGKRVNDLIEKKMKEFNPVINFKVDAPDVHIAPEQSTIK